MSEVTINIDGVAIQAQEGEYVLRVARKNNIFIPALCYLNDCSPTLACRLCLVEIDGKRAYACNAKAKDGMNVITQNEEIRQERRAIMEVYDVNHPLECGVCDQSGECELQNYTLEMEVDSQSHCIQDTHRPTQDWGLIHYDPSLCIVCERCVTVCKDMIGDANLKTVPRGGEPLDKMWKETMPKDSYAMWNKLQKSIIGRVSEDGCDECGECAAVCPVGALVTSDFQYKSNAWELTKIPASNPHSSDCSLLYYDIKHTNVADNSKKIYRVSSDHNFAPLNGAARFGYDFENSVTCKDKQSFEKLINLFQSQTIKQIEFTSFITNEEALILQKLKQKFNLNLVNQDAKNYQKFLQAYQSTSGKSLYSGSIEKVRGSNFLVSLGSWLRSDSPNSSYALNNALTINKGSALYFHPLGDKIVENFAKNITLLPHKIGTEASALYLLLDKFGDKEAMPELLKETLQSLHVKKTKVVEETIKEKVVETVTDKESGETKEVTKFVPKKVTKEVEFDSTSLYDELGIEDLEETFESYLVKKDTFTLLVGEDLYTHPNAKELGELLGLVERYTNFSILIIPSQTNTLGVSLLCDLEDKKEGFTLGYNVKGDFTLSALGDGDLDMPALNQQEGTFTNMNKRVVPTNAALDFKGYNLNDIANALGIIASHTIDYTKELPIEKGFTCKEFDTLPNYFDNGGVEHRGYLLTCKNLEPKEVEKRVENIRCEEAQYIYRANPVNQFSAFTNKAHQLQTTAALHVSEEFIEKHNLQDTKIVKLVSKNQDELIISMQKDCNLQGLIPYLPTFDTKVDVSKFFDTYRFAKVTIEGIKS